ncbi:hypothetical protein [Phenylobacterium sp.]|uniref:hypothetical protein n=1 Tax=Phenylobacterium sp. TaxID=1871053 RepID=UPI0025D48380|nr:hypothetical protein [Phenylobacterium sp.]MBX3485016.1 hypothetical protein [Phenylobacterium sp.]MCW5759982.1 hypothetical protein [Phenylobacterium sp.]
MLHHAPRDVLTHGERLLVRTVRVLALRGGCDGLKGGFEEACGVGGDEAYRTLQVFMQQLGACGRRPLKLSVVTDPALTTDEAAILDVFGCAQADDYASLDERLASLVGGTPPSALGAAACWVAQAFGLNGLSLRSSLTPAATPATLLYAAE